MALITFLTFDQGDASDLNTLGSGASIQNTTTPDSGYALKNATTASTKTITAGSTVTSFSFRFRKPATPGSDTRFYRVWDGTNGVDLMITSADKIKAQEVGTIGLVATTGTATLSNNTNYTIRLEYQHGALPKYIKVWVDDTLDINVTIAQILDNFNRANEGPPPSSSWTTVGSNGLKVVSNQCVPEVSTFCAARWNTAFSADDFVFIDISTLGAVNEQTELYLRWDNASTNGYAVVLKYASGADNLSIYRVDNFVYTLLGATDTSQDFAAGDGIGFSVVGSTLTAYRRSAGTWSSIFSRTDSTYSAAGQAMVATNSGSTQILDNFGQGNPFLSTPNQIQFTGAATTNEYFFDSIAWFDAVDPPKIRTITKQPSTGGTPTYDSWTKSSGADAGALWNDTPFSAADFCTGTTNDTAQTAQVSDFTEIGASDTIQGCRVGVVAKRSNGAATTMSIRRRVNGVDTDTAITTTTSDTFFQESTIWTDTLTNLNSMEIGGLRGSGGRDFVIEDCWVFVAYTPVGTQTVSPSLIGSAEAFGTHRMDQNVVGTAITSAESIGSHTVAYGALNVSPSLIASAESFGTHQIDQNMNANLIASAEAFGTHVIGQNVLANLIASAESIGNHVIAQNINPSLIGSVESFGTHLINQYVLANLIASAEVIGNHTISGITDQTVSPSLIASAEIIGNHVVSIAGTQNVSPSLIASAQAFGTHVINQNIIANLIASAESLPATFLINQNVVANLIASAEGIGTHAISLNVNPTLIASAEIVGSHTIIRGQFVLPSLIGSEEAFGTHLISQNILTSLIASAEAFGTHLINQNINPSLIASAETIGSHTITVAATIIAPSAIVSAEVIGNHILLQVRLVNPPAIASAEILGTPVLSVPVNPVLIASAEDVPSTHFIATLINPSLISSVQDIGCPLIASWLMPAEPGATTWTGVATPSPTTWTGGTTPNPTTWRRVCR